MNWQVFFTWFFAWMLLSALFGMLGKLSIVILIIAAGYVFRHNIIRLVKYGRW